MKPNLEKDINETSWLTGKIKASESYAQNLYAALCNNVFVKDGEEWSCSWRYAGGIVADIRDEGDYLDWYCSGILFDKSNDHGYVEECRVTDEIRADLLSIGWEVVEQADSE